MVVWLNARQKTVKVSSELETELWKEVEGGGTEKTGGLVYWRMWLTLQLSATSTLVPCKL